MSRFKFDLNISQPSSGTELRRTRYFELIGFWDGDEYELTMYSIGTDKGSTEIIHRVTAEEGPTIARKKLVRWLAHQMLGEIVGDLDISNNN